MVTVDDLLAEPSLGVESVHRSGCGAPTIRWVATSELPRPDDFLSGGELLLTTGLKKRTAAEWSALVQRLVELPIAALCFGTGLVHEEVPDDLVRAARDHDLDLLRSDVSVPFVQISQWVIERQVELRERDARRLSQRQDDLVRRLLDGGDLRGVLRGINGDVDGGRLRVVEPDGTVLAQYPAAGVSSGSWSDSPPGLDLPIIVQDRLVARLQSERPAEDARLARFAATVLGMELARRHAWEAGARELLGHVLEDALDRVVPDEQVERRLALQDVHTTDDVWIAVGDVSTSATVLAEVPGLLSPPGRSSDAPDGTQPRTARVRGRPTLLLTSAVPAEETAEALRRRLARVDPDAGVGISGPHTGVDGLRLGWLAASHAAAQGAGVRLADRSTVTWLLLAAADGATESIASRVLGPVRSHDDAHGSDLVLTVRSYLAHDGVVTTVAKDLGVHPNTVRQRIRLVERITGSSLTATATRVELALALRAADLAPRPQGSPPSP